MKFRGACYRLGKSAHFQVSEPTFWHPMCSGRCHVVLTGKDSAYDDVKTVIAWGYDGKSPDLLSVGLLSCALKYASLGLRYFNHVNTGDFYKGDGLWRRKVIKLYRLFTQQVVSKLPDNWEMTTDEIKAWIKNHKKLPACIKQQNQRKHGKAKAEKEGSVV